MVFAVRTVKCSGQEGLQAGTASSGRRDGMRQETPLERLGLWSDHPQALCTGSVQITEDAFQTGCSRFRYRGGCAAQRRSAFCDRAGGAWPRIREESGVAFHGRRSRSITIGTSFVRSTHVAVRSLVADPSAVAGWLLSDAPTRKSRDRRGTFAREDGSRFDPT